MMAQREEYRLTRAEARRVRSAVEGTIGALKALLVVLEEPAEREERSGQAAVLPDLPDVLTVPQTAELLQMHPSNVYRLIEQGKLAAVKVGRSKRVAKASLVRLLTS